MFRRLVCVERLRLFTVAAFALLAGAAPAFEAAAQTRIGNFGAARAIRVEVVEEVYMYDLWHTYLAENLTVEGGATIAYWRYDLDSAPVDATGRYVIGLLAVGLGAAGEQPLGMLVWSRSGANVAFEDATEPKAKGRTDFRVLLTDPGCEGRTLCRLDEMVFTVRQNGNVLLDGAPIGEIRREGPDS